MKVVFSVVLILMMFIGCNSDERERLVQVPEHAVWIGGADGGCWILFGKVTDQTVEATIFFENGEIWEKGVFKRKGDCKVDPATVAQKIIGFDGTRLLTWKKCSFGK